MPLPSRLYFIVDATSGSNAAQDLDHVVPDGEQPYLQYLFIAASDGGNSWGWTLERPAGTTVFAGYGSILMDFGIDGFAVPGASGADLQLTVAATGAGTTSRAFLIGVDKNQL